MTTTSEIETCLNTLRNHPRDFRALRELEEALARTQALSREDAAVLAGSLQYHRERGDWEVVVRLIDVELPRVADAGRRAELLSTKGRILEEELLDEKGALTAFHDALAVRPEDDAIRESVDHILLIRENWEGVAQKYAEEAEGATDRQLATSLFLAAAEVVWRNNSKDPRLEEYLRRSLEVEPRNRKASAHLERYLRLEGRYFDVAQVLEQRAEVAATQEERVQTLLALGDLWARELGSPDEAVTRYRRALSLNPADSWAMRCLVEALTRQEDWAALIRLYEDALRAQAGTDQETGILLQIGMVYDRKLNQTDQAEEYFRRARKVEPTQRLMLDFYRGFYRQKAEPAKVLALLDGAARMEPEPLRRIELLKEMAVVAEEEAGNLEKAIDIWKSIQRMMPANPEAVTSLKRLYRKTQPPKWNALRELLKDEIERLGDEHAEEKIGLLMEVVEIYRDHLRLDVMVINTYNAILSLKPDHAEALRALSEKYEAMGRWNDLIGLLMRRKEVLTDALEKIETLHRVAALWVDKFGNQSQAIRPLEEILELVPTNQKALSALREIHTRRRNWRELMELCRLEAAHREGPRRRELYKEMAWIAADKLGDAREGIQVWNHVLEQGPHDAEALGELATLYRREERWAALAEVLHRQADMVLEDSDQALPILEALGEIYTNRLRAVGNAIEAWREVLRLRPDSPKARVLLRELYVQEQRWEDLDALFRGRGEFSELAETLSSAADRSADRQLKVRLYLKVGQVCWESLSNADRATKAYERVLAIDSENEVAARALVPLYRAGEKWARLLATYEVLLNHAESSEEQLSLLQEIRQLCERQLGSKALAFQWCARAFEIAPTSTELRGELERLAGEAEEWEELVRIYAARVAQIADPEARSEMLRHLAKLCSERLHRPEQAEVYYRELLELDESDVASLEALEQIYTSVQRWSSLVGVYRRRARLEPGDERKVELLFKVAYVQEERLGDPVAAIGTLSEVVAIQPSNIRALRSLDRLHLVRSEWEPLAEVLRREVSVASDKEGRVDLLYRLGDIHRTRLGRHADAVDALAQVLSLDPVHRPTVLALEGYLGAPGDHPHALRVAELLQPFYERMEDWARLAQVLEILLEATEDRETRIALLRRLMQLRGKRLDDPGAAFAAGAQLVALDPEEHEIRRELTVLADRLDRVDEFVGLLVDALHRMTPGETPGTEKTLSWEVALLLDDRLGRSGEAEGYLQRVVALDPTHREAFDLLERILRDTGKFSELRELLERRKELAQAPAARRDILMQISALNEDVLGDTPAAIRSYEEILEIESDHSVSLRALERHYAAARRWQDLLRLLRREMDLVTDDQVINDLKLRQAELLARHLSDAVAATDILEEVLSLDPHLQPAVDLLESLTDLTHLRRRITEILEPVFERRENWADLVRILLARRALAADRFEAVELLCRGAALYEQQINDPASAFASYRQALLLEPGAPAIQEAVERLGQTLAAWNETAETWEKAFEAADPGDLGLRAKLLMRLARVYDERLEDPVLARATYEKLSELDPGNRVTAQPAAEALARLYEAAEKWPELVAVLRRKLDWAEELAERETLLLGIARIHEDVLGAVEAATATYHEILAENPGSGTSLDALERLCLHGEQWENLVDVYRRRVAVAHGAEERRPHWLRIAAVYEEELGALDEAVKAYAAILDDRPEDLEALRALARIHRSTERWPELLEMIERQIPLVEEEAKTGLLFEAAGLQHRHLGQLTVAIDRYQAVLSRVPGHAGSRQALEDLIQDPERRLAVADILAPLYEADANWESLIRILELQAEAQVQVQVQEPALRVALLERIARLCEENVGDLDRAFGALSRALRAAALQPSLLQVIDNFHRVARLQGRWPDFVQALEAVTLEVTDGETQKVLHLLSAMVSREDLGDLERARRHHQAILDLDPDNRAALESLDEVYTELEQWQSLLQVLTRLTELAPDDDSRRALLVRSAQVWRDRLGQPDEAIADYEQVLSLFAADAEAIAALDALYTATERSVDLADLIGRQLRISDTRKDLVGLHYRLGQLRAVRLGDAAGALEEYQAVLQLEPGHEPVIAELEAYLENPDLRVESARILEPIYVARQDWPRLIRIYQFRLEAAADWERRLALSTRIAQLYEEQLEDLEGAFTWYGKVFLEKPSDSAIRDQLLRLAGILDRWSDVAAIFAQYLDRTLEEDETTHEVSLLLGTIYDERLWDVERAMACFQRPLRVSRSDPEAFVQLEGLLTRSDRWHDLLALYQEFADATVEMSGRREILLKICRVWEEALENYPEAIDAYRTVLDLDDRDSVALQALDRLYTETGRWQDLAELLARECDVAESESESDTVALKFRIATIHELRLEDLAGAIDLCEEVLRRDPSHGGAVSALERLILDRDHRFRISQILEPIYRQQDEWAKLVVIYDAQLDFIEDPDRRAFLLREIARLHEDRDGSLDLAFRAVARAFQEEPSNAELLGEVERLAGKLGNWVEVVAVLGRAAEGLYDFGLVARIQAKIAEIQETSLGDGTAAVEAWRRVLAAQEDSLVALSALERLLGALARNAELIDVLTRRAELTPDLDQRKAIGYRIAEIHETVLGHPERAVDTYRLVLGLDEFDRTALNALERLYLVAGSWMDLIWVYRRKIDTTTDEADRRALQLSVAKVYEDKVGDHFEAIAAYKSLQEEAPNDPEVLDALDRLYTQEQLYSDLLDVLNAKIDGEKEQTARNGLLFRAAAILEREVGDIDAAVERYRQVVEVDPAHAGAREALERLVRSESHLEIVAAILEQLYQKRGEVKPLIEVLELKLETLADPVARRDLLLRMGRLCEEGLDDLRGALSAYSRAFDEDPAYDLGRRDLERVAETLQAIPELVAVYERRLSGIYDTDLGREIHLKVARILEEVLKEDDRAAEHYRAALHSGGDEREPLLALDRIFDRQKKWQNLLEILGREIQVVPEGGAQANLYFRTGEIQQRAGEMDAAFGAYRDALDRDPGHGGARQALEDILLENESYRVPALDVLEPVYEASGDFAKVVQLLEVRLGTINDPAERTATLERIARYHEEKLGAHEQALGSLGRAMAEDPGNERVLDGVERLADHLQRFRELAALAEEILGAGFSVEATRALGLRSATWYSEKLGDVGKAEWCLKKVVEADPECVPALEGLERIYRAVGNDAELAQVLWQRGAVEPDGGHRQALLAEVARIRQKTLQDSSGAIAAWRAVLEVDAGHGEALQALADLYQMGESWEGYLDVLDRQHGLADSPEVQVELKHRAGEVLRNRVKDLDRTVEAYRDVLDLAPGDVRAVEALEAIFTEREEWASLQEVLVRKLDSKKGKERIPVLLRLGDVSAERLAAVDDAIGYYHQILVEDLEHVDAIQRLERILREAARWYDLVDTLRRHAEILARRGDKVGELEQLVQAARIWNDSIGNPESAAELLEEVLRRDEKNVSALAGLARIYETTRQWDRCREVLKRAASLNPEPKEAAELEVRMGKVELEQGGDEAKAAAHYARALELDPGHAEAADGLETISRKQENWPRLVELLEARGQRASDPAERMGILRELGTLYSDRLGQPDKGVQALERAHELSHDSTDILMRLADVYFAAGRYDDAAPLIQRLIDLTGRRRGKELAQLVYRMGAIAEKKGDLTAARDQYDQAYRMDSTYAPTLVSLGRIYVNLEDWENTRRLYRSMLLQNLDESAGIAKADIFFHLGQAHAALGEKAKALSMFERGLEVNPAHQGLQEAMGKAKG